MFIVFNKEKINAYLISLATVLTLFVIGLFLSNKNIEETSAHIANANMENTLTNDEKGINDEKII